MSRKLKIKNYFLKLTLCAVLFCLSLQSAVAVDINPIYSIHIDEATIKKGYEIKGFDDKLQIAIFPFVLKMPTRIELKNRTEIARIEDIDKLMAAGNEDGAGVLNNISTTTIDAVIGTDVINRVSTTTTEFIASEQLKIENSSSSAPLLLGENPEGWEINSDIYEFDVRDKGAYDGGKPFVVTLACNNETDNRQKMFYFDSGKNEWMPLPSTIMQEEKSVRAIIHLPYAKVAVFEHKKIIALGNASWYKYKGCNCAASPDYPKGAKLKVTNLYNDKSVIVEVNDYGPDRNIFSKRVVDLDIEAFTKIAKKGAGIIDVKVEPLDEICSYAFEKAKHPETPAPEISAPFAVLIDEPTGEILYAKNEKEKTPMASITKLMTASVFMELQNEGCKDVLQCVSTAWDKIITYNKADDLDGAKLYVNDGETMTIKDIFYSMLVGSANNAAKTLVENSGIEYNAFVEKMNKKAKEWRLENTEFKDPTGLNAGNVSTALDVANMARKILKNFEMLKATTISQYSFKTINTGNAHTIKNTDNLLLDKDLYVTGAKTGFLNEAGYCLALKAKNKNDGREVIAVVLGEDSSEDRFVDVKKLIQWGAGN